MGPSRPAKSVRKLAAGRGLSKKFLPKAGAGKVDAAAALAASDKYRKAGRNGGSLRGWQNDSTKEGSSGCAGDTYLARTPKL
jgi:hypothetical protein